MNLPTDVRSWKPMLCESAPDTEDTLLDLQRRGYAGCVKWDGQRAFALIDNGDVTLLNRKGEAFTYQYPELVSAFANQFAGRSVVLDGEVLIFDPATGVPKFTLLGQRRFGPGRTVEIARMAKAIPATYVAFDVIAAGPYDMRKSRQDDRFDILDGLPLDGQHIKRSIRSSDLVALMDIVKKMNLEGLIAKKLDAPYRAGRHSAWLKVKPTHDVTCVVTGWEPGEGWRSDTFGALTIAVIGADGEDVPIGKVGSGFSVPDLEALDPFVKAGTRPLIDVTYQERQPGTGVLRFPRLKGLRWDLDESAASADQFDRTPSA